jgi:hypothetical protein
VHGNKTVSTFRRRFVEVRSACGVKRKSAWRKCRRFFLDFESKWVNKRAFVCIFIFRFLFLRNVWLLSDVLFLCLNRKWKNKLGKKSFQVNTQFEGLNQKLTFKIKVLIHFCLQNGQYFWNFIQIWLVYACSSQLNKIRNEKLAKEAMIYIYLLKVEAWNKEL